MNNTKHSTDYVLFNLFHTCVACNFVLNMKLTSKTYYRLQTPGTYPFPYNAMKSNANSFTLFKSDVKNWTFVFQLFVIFLSIQLGQNHKAFTNSFISPSPFDFFTYMYMIISLGRSQRKRVEFFSAYNPFLNYYQTSDLIVMSAGSE